jgi:hypothetical protein
LIDVEVRYEFNGVADDSEKWYLVKNVDTNIVKWVDEYNFRLIKKEGLTTTQ